MRARRLLTLFLLAALVLPGALCAAGQGDPGRMGCCPSGAADAPMHMRACCPSEDGQPATAGPTASSVLTVPASVCCPAGPSALLLRHARRANASPVASVPIRLLISVFLI